MWQSRRRAISIIGVSLIAIPGCATNDNADGTLNYRGFVVDMTAARNAPNFAAIESSLKHQLDIVADCGAQSTIIDFFRGRRLMLVYGLQGQRGRFIPNHGIDIEAAVLPPQQPIILNELLQAYHFLVLPGGFENPDVMTFYNRAIEYHFYPAIEVHDGVRVPTFLLTDVRTFFAVTASAFLAGSVDREPYSRQRLKMLQPVYYEWLQRQFGV